MSAFAKSKCPFWCRPCLKTVEMHPVGVWSGWGQMEAKTLNKVGYSSPSAAWTGIIPARTTTNSEMQQPAPILSSEDRQRTTFFCSFYEDCFFSPLILLFMFIDKLLAVSDGKSTMATSQNTAQFKRWLVGVSSPPAALTGRSAFEGKVVMCHCGLWTEMLLSQPDFEIALDNVCAKFYFVYICQCSQNNPRSTLYTFSVLRNTTIYHNSNNKPKERLSGAAEHRSLWEHCMSSAEAPYLPRNGKLCMCVCVWVCVYVCTLLNSVWPQTARVKKHNCSSFSKWVLN